MLQVTGDTQEGGVSNAQKVSCYVFAWPNSNVSHPSSTVMKKLNRGEVSNTCPSRQGATQTEATKGKIDTPKHEHTRKNTKCMRDASTMKQGADMLKKKLKTPR